MVLQVKSLEDEFAIYDELEKNSMISVEEVVNLLNELDEKYVDEFSLRETLQQELQRVENENEQLKIKLEDIALDMENAKEFNDDAQYELYKIKKENEQLKSVLKEIVRVSEYNGAISPMRVKSMTYNFIGDLND